jgi:6-phospho-beta-glucosidase
MKLAVLGGGGVRSPFLAKSIVANCSKIGLTEVIFMDNNAKKLAIYGKIAQLVAKKMDPTLKFSTTTDAVEAVTDADFVITTLRVGEDKARTYDERVALDLGVLGQETTGAGGFAMAMRSIPVLLDYCKLIDQHAKKNVQIFNFTNPSGLVTQALRSQGYNNVYGVCDAPSGFKIQLLELLKVEDNELSMQCFGLNHLSWFRKFILNGKDITKDLMSNERLYSETEMHIFDPELVRLSGGDMMLNEYLYFFYYRERAVESILKSKQTRGESIQDINRKMTADLENLDIEADLEKAFDIFTTYYLERENSYMAAESGEGRACPKSVPTLQEYIEAPDEGGYAGVALRFIDAVNTGKNIEMVLSVPNNGAIEGLEDEDVVEISCKIDKNGAYPVKIGKVPDFQMNLIKTVKFYEKMAAKAIIEKNRDAAVIALTAHPLVNSYNLATKLVDKYLEVHAAYTGDWK